MSALVAVGLFAGAVSMAVGAEHLRQFIGQGTGLDDFLRTVTDALAAGAVSIFYKVLKLSLSLSLSLSLVL